MSKTWTGYSSIPPVLVTAGLVVNEKLVCVGRYPKKEEVVGWLREALE